MADTWYVDPDASGNNDGSSQADAWESLQEAIDSTNNPGKPAAGDLVLCKAQDGSTADETLSAKIDFDALDNPGGNAHIVWKGVNSSWVEDGTRYVIDAAGVAANCIDWGNIDGHIMCNFLFKRATGNGVNFNVASASYIGFCNCRFTDNGGYGVYTYRLSIGLFFRCLADNNDDDNYYISGADVFFCCARDGGAAGFAGTYSSDTIIGCIAYDNAEEAMLLGAGNAIFNTLDAHTLGVQDGVNFVADGLIALGNRITNFDSVGKYAIDGGDETIFLLYNYLHGNADEYNNCGAAYKHSINGVDTNLVDVDVDDGYTTPGADYNLKASRTYRRFGISVPIV